MFRRRRNQELDEEIRAHLEMEAQQRVEAGESPESARAGARRDFGNLDLVKEVTRDTWGWRWLETLLQDTRYGLRALRRTPTFTIVAVLSLALGIGANTAIITVLNAVLWKPLPVDDPARLVQVGTVERESGRMRAFPSELLAGLAGLEEIFAGVAGRTDFDGVALRVEGRTERVVAEVVTGRYFALLGVSPFRGRYFSSESDGARWEPEAVLSHASFRRLFGADPGVVGRTIHLNGYPFTVIGVAPPHFCGMRIGETPDVWLPAMLEADMQARRLPALAILNAGPGIGVNPIARLGAGVSRERAEAAADVLLQHWLSHRPNTGIVRGPARVRLEDAEDASRANNRVAYLAKSLTVALGIAAAMALVACVNLASLLLARGASRQREMATRLAIGAGRGRLVRQLLVESLLIAAGGGLIGFALAQGGAAALCAVLLPPGSVTSLLDVSPDLRVLACAAAVSVSTALVFGLGPALRASRQDLVGALKSDSAMSRGRRGRLGQTVIAAEMALCLVLVAAAGLFVRSLRHLQQADPAGAGHVVMFSLKPVRDGGVRYPPGRLEAFFPELERRISGLPGVSAVSVTSGKQSAAVPQVTPMGEPRRVRIEREDGPQVTADVPIVEGVTAGFFPMFGITPSLGRTFTDHDHGRRVMVVSEPLARDIFGPENPLGRHVRVHRRGSWADPWEIVGVVPSAAWDRPGKPASRLCFIPFVQPGLGTYDGDISTLLVRADAPAAAGLASLVRREIQALDKELPIFNVRTVAEEISRGRRSERLLASLSGLMGGLAALLAAIGLYGVIAYSVTLRRREIGIRLAIGADRRSVLAAVLGDALRLVSIGVLAGLPLVLFGGRLVAGQLHGIAPHDPPTLLASIAVLAVVGALAGWLPACRAAALPPASALRAE